MIFLFWQSLTSLVFPLQQNLHGGLWSPFKVEFTETRASRRGPGCSGAVGPHPALFSRALINRMPLCKTEDNAVILHVFSYWIYLLCPQSESWRNIRRCPQIIKVNNIAKDIWVTAFSSFFSLYIGWQCSSVLCSDWAKWTTDCAFVTNNHSKWVIHKESEQYDAKLGG